MMRERGSALFEAALGALFLGSFILYSFGATSALEEVGYLDEVVSAGLQKITVTPFKMDFTAQDTLKVNEKEIIAALKEVGEDIEESLKKRNKDYLLELSFSEVEVNKLSGKGLKIKKTLKAFEAGSLNVPEDVLKKTELQSLYLTHLKKESDSFTFSLPTAAFQSLETDSYYLPSGIITACRVYVRKKEQSSLLQKKEREIIYNIKVHPLRGEVRL